MKGISNIIKYKLGFTILVLSAIVATIVSLQNIIPDVPSEDELGLLMQTITTNTASSSSSLANDDDNVKGKNKESRLILSDNHTNETASSAAQVIHEPGLEKKVTESTESIEQQPTSRIANETSYEKSEDEERIWNITIPWKNVTTVGYDFLEFQSGYRNQMMMFAAFVMRAGHSGHDQILLTSLRHKDTYGTNQYYPHEYFFDVQHWNSFYPKLPRMVHCDPEIFSDFDCTKKRWRERTNATRPYSQRLDHRGVLFLNYKRYAKGNGGLAKPTFPNPMDVLMLRGAIRPHPELLALVHRLLGSLDGNGTVPYMALHARVEPDMVAQNICTELKENNLTKIFQYLEETFPDPPAPRVFLPINRQLMESHGQPNLKKPKKTNWIAVHNLEALNRAVRDGLWGGRSKVFEFGSNALLGTRYENTPATAGAILNFYIAQHAEIFIGTEVSTYSMDLLHARFYSGNRNNYYYRPDGLHVWTTNETKHPPPFRC